MTSSNNKDFNGQNNNFNSIFSQNIEYDPVIKKYYVSHRYYTKYFNTIQEALNELYMCSMIGEPINFSNASVYEKNKIDQNEK